MAWLIVLLLAIVVGICLGVAASGAWSSPAPVRDALGRTTSGSVRKVNSGLGIGVGIIASALLGFLVSLPFGVKIIEPGMAGVRMAFGSFAGDPLPNGVHLVAPWVQIIKYPVKIQEYTMSATPAEGQTQGDDSIAVLCSDRLQMSIDCTVFYCPKVEKLNWIHANLGQNYMTQYLRPLIRKIIPEVFGKFNAMDVSTSGREEACKAAQAALEPEFDKMGITLTEVNLRHIQPPQQVLDAISLKLAAVENAKRMESEGQGLVARARGEAEANKLRQVTITPMLIQWEQIQAWRELAKSDNAKVIVPAGSGTNLLIQP